MNLNRKNFAELFRNDYYTVGVLFPSSGNEGYTAAKQGAQRTTYTYKVPKEIKLSKGDRIFVCVENNLDLVSQIKCCTVMEVNNEPEIDDGAGFTYKWIVGTFERIMAGYQENIEKDNKLKKAVFKLEKAMERVSIRTQLAEAMKILGDDDKKELAELFNMPQLLENNGGQGQE